MYEQKRCTKCSQLKYTFTEFSKIERHKQRYDGVCKKCRAARARERWKAKSEAKKVDECSLGVEHRKDFWDATGYGIYC